MLTNDLADYLATANQSAIECQKEHQDVVGLLDELDHLFRKLVTGIVPDGTTFGIAHVLGMNAHANYLAAIGTALRGLYAPTFMILRGCLESALYAFLASENEDDARIWLKRAENMEACRTKFTVNRAVQKLAIDPNLASAVKDSHQWMIEFGAHPNPRSILDALRWDLEREDAYHSHSMIYIHSPDSLSVVRCLSACAENATMVLSVLAHAFPNHPDALQIHKKAWQLFEEVHKVMIEKGYLSEEWEGKLDP